MPVDTSYEATRRRHFAYAMELFPSYLARLRWSRTEIVAEQTDALRALFRHAITSSPWHRELLRHVDVDGFTPARLRSILGKEPAIVEYQVRQTDGGADVDIVARADVDADAIRRRLASVGLDVPRVAVRRVDGIDRQGSGKLKRFVPLVRR